MNGSQPFFSYLTDLMQITAGKAKQKDLILNPLCILYIVFLGAFESLLIYEGYGKTGPLFDVAWIIVAGVITILLNMKNRTVINIGRAVILFAICSQGAMIGLYAFIPVDEAMQGTGITQSIANEFLPVAARLPHVVSLGALLAGTLILSNIINHGANCYRHRSRLGDVDRSLLDGSCGCCFIAVSYPGRSSGQHFGYGARRLRIRR